MNKKAKGELRKDKDLVKELYSIICMYPPNLLTLFDNLTDTRNSSYITYSMKTICVTRLLSLLCRLTTITDISSNNFNTDKCINNLSKICNQNLKEIPDCNSIFYFSTLPRIYSFYKFGIKP